MSLPYACINYCRHIVPKDIAIRCGNILRQSTNAVIYKVHQMYEFDHDIELEYAAIGHYYIDLYMSILAALREDTNHQYFFLTEGDIEYNQSHFVDCLQAIKKNPNKIICNKNFYQKLENTYRKNLDYVRPLASLMGSKQVLIQELELKLQEIMDFGGVNWLEPGYNRDGAVNCFDVASKNTILEIRHQHSSTALSSWIIQAPREQAIESVKDNKNTRVAIIGLLSHFEPQYSVSNCIYDHLNLMNRYCENLVFIAPSDFRDMDSVPSGVEVRKIPRYHGDPLKDSSEQFEEFVVNCTEQLKDALIDIDVCIEHDGIFLDCFLPYNAAIRNVSKENNLKWIHWIHSAPNLNPPPEEYPQSLLRSPMGNSVFVSLNETNRLMLAQMYNMNEKDVVFIPNIIDPVHIFDFHPLTEEIYRGQKLWDQDIICVYPARTVQAKQPDKIIRLLAACKQQGAKVKFIYCNSYANAEAEMTYLNSLIELAAQENFSNNFVPTSILNSEWCTSNEYNNVLGMPHKVVLDLLKISDLFILPSVSEGCSLIMLEAALHKNLMVLNDDLDTLHDFGGETFNDYESTKSVYFRFGSLKVPLHDFDRNEKLWYKNKASILLESIKKDKALEFFKFIRRSHAPDYVYLNYLKQFLHPGNYNSSSAAS